MNQETLGRIVSLSIAVVCTLGSTSLLPGCSDDGQGEKESNSTLRDAGSKGQHDASRNDDDRDEGQADGGSQTANEYDADGTGEDDHVVDTDAGHLQGDAGGPTDSIETESDAGAGTQSSAVDAASPDIEVPSGSVPEELVGVWQETRASSGDYTNQFGEDFSATSGFSAQLKITADGKYYFAHYASGVSSNCASVSQFDQSVGSAVLDGNTLTLTPVERRIDFQNCTDSTSTNVDATPMVLTVSLAEDRQFYGGMRSYKLGLTGYSIPLDLSSLFRLPTYAPVQPELPAEFVAGDTPPYSELQGLWVAAAGTDTNFYEPETDEYYLPELNGSSHHWLRFDGDSYETAVALQNVNSEGVCKLDLIYYEKGSATFAITEDVGGQGSHFVGHTSFVSEDSRLIVNIRECDEDNGAVRYDLTPLTSYFRWIYFSPDNPPESFSWSCDFPQSEWQSLLCNGGTAGFSRRE